MTQPNPDTKRKRKRLKTETHKITGTSDLAFAILNLQHMYSLIRACLSSMILFGIFAAQAGFCFCYGCNLCSQVLL